MERAEAQTTLRGVWRDQSPSDNRLETQRLRYRQNGKKEFGTDALTGRSADRSNAQRRVCEIIGPSSEEDAKMRKDTPLSIFRENLYIAQRWSKSRRIVGLVAQVPHVELRNIADDLPKRFGNRVCSLEVSLPPRVRVEAAIVGIEAPLIETREPLFVRSALVSRRPVDVGVRSRPSAFDNELRRIPAARAAKRR